MKKWVQSRRESAETVGALESKLHVSLGLQKSAQASCEEPEEGVVYLRLDSFTFVMASGDYIPFLGSGATMSLFPSATVDEGAIKFLLNGADVMRPGVKSYDSWGPKGRLVGVKEAGKGRNIAVGVSMVASEEMDGMEKGGCLRNIHHVGDRYWELYKRL